ncbi:MAG: hypothetical protein FWB80_06035 [Defluviitaleaceae bacterium]|nr:hypothetical protein [Defluviitaleaceae bacterium]
MRNRLDGVAAKNRVFRGFAATGETDFELIRYTYGISSEIARAIISQNYQILHRIILWG